MSMTDRETTIGAAQIARRITKAILTEAAIPAILQTGEASIYR
jgi:hypothetical protein